MEQVSHEFNKYIQRLIELNIDNPYITDGRSLSDILWASYELPDALKDNIKNLMTPENYGNLIQREPIVIFRDDGTRWIYMFDPIENWCEDEFRNKDWDALYEANKHLKTDME